MDAESQRRLVRLYGAGVEVALLASITEDLQEVGLVWSRGEAGHHWPGRI
jgi:hypothetical protein